LSIPEQNIFTWDKDDGVLEGEETEDEYEKEGPENSETINTSREEIDEIPTAAIPVCEHEEQSKTARKPLGWMQDFVSGEEEDDNWANFVFFHMQ